MQQKCLCPSLDGCPSSLRPDPKPPAESALAPALESLVQDFPDPTMPGFAPSNHCSSRAWDREPWEFHGPTPYIGHQTFCNEQNPRKKSHCYLSPGNATYWLGSQPAQLIKLPTQLHGAQLARITSATYRPAGKTKQPNTIPADRSAQCWGIK